VIQLQVVLGRERERVHSLGDGVWHLGRDAQNELALGSDLVSRRHARIVVQGGAASIADLGSRNGTYVNGARVLGEAAFALNDVLLVGDVALRVHGAVVSPLAPEAPRAADAAVLPLHALGSLVEVPPATVLRYAAVVKKTGVLVLTSPPLEGRVAYTRGHVAEVLVGGRRTRDPIQALTVMLRWRGTFELDAPAASSSTLLLGLDAVLPAIGSHARPSSLPR